MMATRPVPPPNAATSFNPFTRRSPSRGKGDTNRSRLQPVCTSPRSVDLAGRAVALSADIPAMFDAPLAPHHKLLGRWAALHEDPGRRYTRSEACTRIERVFNDAVIAILAPVELADLRVMVLEGEGDLPPLIALICDSLGQMDLGWIEKSNVLRDALRGPVAPLGWRAAAYKALGDTLGHALPVFGFDELFEELSCYYWDGEATDEGALRVLTEFHGHDPDDIDPDTLPGAVKSRRPDWMLADNAAPLKRMPPSLRSRLRRLRDTCKALAALGADGNAWRCNTEHFHDYLPEYCDRSTLPPMTIVSFDVFAREIDDVARSGMEYGFNDVIGLCPLTDPVVVDCWLASLKVGVDYLLAAQDLIDANPAQM